MVNARRLLPPTLAACGVLAATRLLVWAVPPDPAHPTAGPLAALRACLTSPDIDRALPAALALLAWLVVGWLALGTLLATAATLPGRLGAAADLLARFVTPLAVRRVVEVAIGVSVALGSAAGVAMPAGATTGRPATAASAPHAYAAELDRPASGQHAQLELALDRPAQGAQPDTKAPATTAVPITLVDRPAAAPAAAGDASTGVVVRPGDTLWTIAAASLGAGCSPAEVAQAWPRWYAANRDRIGDRPDVLRPGIVLLPPAR